MQNRFLITNTTKGRPSGLPFANIKAKLLGNKYDLSVVFVGEQKIKSLNRIYRGIDKATDILSFDLSSDTGEIYLCQKIVAKKAKAFGMKEKDYLNYLFIHGILHLKGFDHGEKMETLEKKYCKQFGLKYPQL